MVMSQSHMGEFRKINSGEIRMNDKGHRVIMEVSALRSNCNCEKTSFQMIMYLDLSIFSELQDPTL